VNTIDNQPIAVTVGLTYRIPPQAVLPLLYEVGSRPVILILPRTLSESSPTEPRKFFAQQNTTRISENREQIFKWPQDSFIERPREPLTTSKSWIFQIAGILYSDSFRAFGRGCGQGQERGRGR